ncbi:acyl-coenzyme A diphosphatase FITM2 [Colletes gigas]|uniref:acyl-coenzyme A diphosphatase FITM2 n=1 Tax=Colletes gigas TaxID=935657 RepID=UPI001C9AB984|nr:acyl-coenzyme A diphosphatase FITM2 [Colletes gigas]XP_043260398.1 acyl-coenzyme A diphosphatase FITM2 [Colletes gigas]
MATGKRRSVHTTLGNSAMFGSAAANNLRTNRLNFRPNSTQEDRGGTRPTAAPSSIGLIFVTMFLHVCKKSLLFDTRLKVAIYCGAIFVVSLIADFTTMPRTYFSRSDNALNQYFVKWGWGWLLTITVPWVALTAYTVGCGRRSILLKHLARLGLATVAWLLWIKLFNYIETNYGRCLNTRDIQLQTKRKCLQSGRFWSSIDISGHTFILIYSSLILAEEGSSLIGWEGIKDLIMREEHSRITPNEPSTGPLRNLSNLDLEFLKKAHKALTPYLRGLFVAMTLQQLLWDIMLISTILYYHIMIEKFVGGVAAVLTWYVTYQWWYKSAKSLLLPPGDGLFKYNEVKVHDSSSIRSRRSTLNGTNRFMGLPIRISQDNIDTNGINRQLDSDVIATRL